MPAKPAARGGRAPVLLQEEALHTETVIGFLKDTREPIQDPDFQSVAERVLAPDLPDLRICLVVETFGFQREGEGDPAGAGGRRLRSRRRLRTSSAGLRSASSASSMRRRSKVEAGQSGLSR